MHDEKHLIHYFVLFVGLLSFFLVFFIFRYDSVAQIYASGAASLFYVLWGIIHHSLENRLTKMIILEYILFGTLAFICLFAVLSY